MIYTLYIHFVVLYFNIDTQQYILSINMYMHGYIECLLLYVFFIDCMYLVYMGVMIADVQISTIIFRVPI